MSQTQEQPASMPHTQEQPPGSGLRAGAALAGAVLRSLTMHPDERGCFTEFFVDAWGLPIHPSQWSVVSSHPRALRGMHFHRRHDEYIAVIAGRASVGLYDLRPKSPTFGLSALIELDGRDQACLAFPRGILHGWYFHEPTIHLQAVSESYEDYHDDDNFGCRWSDPELNIPWCDPKPIVSTRAHGFRTLSELKALVDF